LAFTSALFLFLTGCAGTSGRSASSSEGTGGMARAQLERGEAVYREYCYACHEVESGAGEELSPRLLVSYHSARSLYDYIDLAMPYNEPGSLSVEESWAVTAYLIEDRGLARLDAPLTADVAEGVRLSIEAAE
jgi:cytochrome c